MTDGMITTLLLIGLGAVVGAAVVFVFVLRDRQAVAGRMARLEAERDLSARSLDEHRRTLAESQAQLRDAFAALSRSALKENRDDFLHTAGSLFQSVKEGLDRVQVRLAEVDRAREGSQQAVTSQIGMLSQMQEQLRSAADSLSKSLRSPNVRGKWGEVQLRRIVELSGMLEHCDFAEKLSAFTADGARQTPDLLIRLPGEASIVVDAKAPLTAYLKAAEATSDVDRQEHLAAHARQLRDHVKALGQKDYARQFQPAPDFVVMFLPLEPLLAAAFEQDGTLLDYAADLRVIPATPMTLLALLRAVAMGWRQQQVARNTEELQDLGRDLYERLARLVEHLQDMGSHLGQAADSYNRLIGSLETKVLPAARRFKGLGVSSPRELDEPELLDVTIRRVVRDELVPTGED
jgi:DNA recombination protein RmuC